MFKMNLSDVQKLHQKKYRKQFGYFIVEGLHLVEELEKTEFNDCELLVTEKFFDYKSRFPIRILTEDQFRRLSEVRNQQGIAAIVATNNLEKIPIGKQVFYLDNIQDPGNLGTIIRSAAWFDQFSICLSPDCVDPFNSKVIRSTMGAIFNVRIEIDITISALLERFQNIACLDMIGDQIGSGSFQDFNCYMIGNEANGIRKKLNQSDRFKFFSINSMNPKTESLNAAIAAAIAMYELRKG